MTLITALDIENRFNVNRIFAYYLSAKSETEDDVQRYILEKPKPFVKWVGGKRQLLKQFKEMNLYPPEGFNPKTNQYFEPFVGGGAVFFDLMPKHARLSDINRELIITYKVIRDDVESLISHLKQHRVDKEYFLQTRSLDINQLTDLEIASRFIFLNRTGFNGMYRVNKQGKFNVPFGKYNNPLICDEINLRRVSQSLQDVAIDYADYKTILDHAKPGDFIYFDPPYHPISKTASFTSYTANSFSEADQIALRDVYVELHRRGCYVMLSNSNADFINQIYANIPNIKINKVLASRAINSNAAKRGKIKEVLITNY